LTYDDYKIKLGNLTMLEKPINIEASNESSINRINSNLKLFTE